MPSRRITDYTELTTPDANAVLPIVDTAESVPSNRNKKIKIANLTSQLSAASTSAAGIVRLNYDEGNGASRLGEMAEENQSLSSVLSAALPSAIAAGLFAIGALLVNIQIQQAATSAGVQQLVKSVEELKTDSKQRLDDLERRVRTLEIKN